MTDRPIIFSGPMVRALLDGRKTMTRRLAYDKKGNATVWSKLQLLLSLGTADHRRLARTNGLRVGDRLWVRENWRVPGDCSAELSSTSTCVGPEDLEFAADFTGMDFDMRRWRPSIHIPRWGSRITLEVTAVKIEKLQAISEQDCKAEGCVSVDMATGRECILDPGMGSYYIHFAAIWTNLHGQPSWDDNPEVVAISFKVHHSNIDRVAA